MSAHDDLIRDALGWRPQAPDHDFLRGLEGQPCVCCDCRIHEIVSLLEAALRLAMEQRDAANERHLSMNPPGGPVRWMEIAEKAQKSHDAAIAAVLRGEV